MSISFGPGTYTFADPLVIRGHGDAILGAGIEATRLVYTGQGPAIVNVVPDGETIHWGVRCGGFTLEGGGIALASTYKARVEDLRITRSTGAGIRLYRNGSAFAAYNLLQNIIVDMSGEAGNAVVLDAGSELNHLVAVNGSYARAGAFPATHTEEPDLSSGVGLLIASGNNTVEGGHFDRCLYGIAYLFADGNTVRTATDNAVYRAVTLKGATSNVGEIAVGRCDPSMPDGTPNPRYGASPWAAVHACNTTAGNRTLLAFRRDTDPPPLPPGRSSWPRGGWSTAIHENSGTGKAEHGGPNRWIVLPEGQMPYKLDGLGVILR